MFQNLAFMMQNNAFLRALLGCLGLLPYSCGSPLNPSPTGGLRLPAGKHTAILTDIQTKDKEKMKKKCFFNRRFHRFMAWIFVVSSTEKDCGFFNEAIC